MALAAINVKKPREAQIWNCCTGNPVLRILPDSNIKIYKSAWNLRSSTPARLLFSSKMRSFALMYMAINPTQGKRYPRRAESPMERLAQGKRSGTLGM